MAKSSLTEGLKSSRVRGLPPSAQLPQAGQSTSRGMAFLLCTAGNVETVETLSQSVKAQTSFTLNTSRSGVLGGLGICGPRWCPLNLPIHRHGIFITAQRIKPLGVQVCSLETSLSPFVVSPGEVAGSSRIYPSSYTGLVFCCETLHSPSFPVYKRF